MDATTRNTMRDWLVRLHTKLQKGDRFTAGEWGGRYIIDCIHELDDAALQQEWRSYQC